MDKLTQKIDSKHDREQVWLTRKELQERTNWSEGKIRNLKNKNKIIFRVSKGNGGEQFQYLLSSIPILTDEEQQAGISENPIFPQSINEVISTEIEIIDQKSDVEKPRREILEKDKDKIEVVLQVIREYKASISKVKHGETIKLKQQFVKWFDEGIILPELRKKFGKIKRYKTLDEYIEKFERSGNDPGIFIRKKKSFKPIVPEEHLLAFAGFHAHPHRPRFEESLDHTIEFLMAHKREINYSKTTLRRYCSKFYLEHKPLFDAAREGKKYLTDIEAPNVQRDNDLLVPGQELSWDGKDLDFLIEGKRKTLLLSKDVGSTAICGFVLADSETTEAVQLLLFRSIMFLQKKPIAIRPDNGSAFRSKDIKEIMDALQISYVFVAVGNAKGKSVERTNQTIEKFERYFPTYIGTSIQNKPAHFNQREFEAKKNHKTLYNGAIITTAQADEAIVKFIELYNNQIIKSGKHKGQKRIDVFNQGKGNGINPLELTYLMMKKIIKKSNKNGIRINGYFYYNTKMFGKRVSYIIRYDRIYDEVIYLFDVETGEFLFEAFRREKVDPQALLFGDDESAKAVFQQIQLGKQLVKQTFDDLSKFNEKVVKPTNNYLLHKIGLAAEPVHSGISSLSNNGKIIDAEIISEVDHKLILKTGTDNITIETVEEKKSTEFKTKGFLFNKLNKK